MSGICSRHKKHNPNCNLCNAIPQDILPDYNKKVADAEAAGTHMCTKCSYVFYLTVNYCPQCNKKIT